MSRTRRRVSRALIACLGVTLALGLVSWFHNTSKSKAAEKQASAAEQLPPPPKTSSELRAEELKARGAPVAPSAAQQPGGVVTQTPTIPAARATPTTATPDKKGPGAFTGTTSVDPAIFASTPATPVSSKPLVDAQAKIESGNLLEGRAILAAALSSKTLSPADSAAVKAKLTEINQTVVFSRTLYPSDEFGGTYKVQPGDRMEKIAATHDVTWQLLARVNGIEPKRLQAGKTIKMVKGPFHGVVDKSDFTFDLWIGPPEEPGSMYVTTYKVGLGSDDSTPTGTWIVSGKLENPAYYSPRGEGVIDGDDPKNPLGEYWMSLEGIDGKAVGAQSYGIHGTIEPDSIGKQASMGCIRLLNEDVTHVYEMLADGKSTVVVRE